MRSTLFPLQKLSLFSAKFLFNSFSIVGIFVLFFSQAHAQTAPSLGTAASFAVLGGSTVTNTGPSVISGNLGVSPGTAVTGFPPGLVVGGSIHAADALAAQAQADTTRAFVDLGSEACTATFNVPSDLSGQTLVPGVYCYASTVGLTGTLTLNAQGNPNAVFIFKIGSTLITGSNASVNLINGAQQCGVFFKIGSSATLGTGTRFVGNIVALTSITLNTGATLSGRALARNGAVTLDTNTVSLPTCASPPVNAAPILAKSFSPATVSPDSLSTLTLTLTNTNSTADALTAPLTDSLPAGIFIAGAGTTTCGGVVVGNAGEANVTLRGGTIPAAGSCTVTIPVKGAVGGSYINSIGIGALMTSSGTNSTPAIATLTITGTGGGGGTGGGTAPTVGKTFSPSSITQNGVSTVTLTLNNSNSSPASLTSSFTDSLPVGMVVYGAASTTCGGAVTAVKGGSSITLQAGSIPANGACKVTVPVTADCAGNYYNSIHAGALQTTKGSNPQAVVATLTVNAPPAPGGSVSLAKSFWPTQVVPGGTSTLYIDLKNPDASAARLTAPLIDHLPTGMTVAGGGASNCGGTITAVVGSSDVTLTGGTIPANAGCRIIVQVNATTAGKPSAVGNYINTLGVGVLMTSSGSNKTPASATLTVSTSANSGPTLAKIFSPNIIKQGQSSTLILYLKNSASTVAKLTAPFSDHMPNGMVVSGAATNTCGGVVTAVRGSSTVTLSGGAIPANGSCRITVAVTAPCAHYWNQIGVGALQTTNGSNKETYGASLVVALN